MKSKTTPKPATSPATRPSRAAAPLVQAIIQPLGRSGTYAHDTLRCPCKTCIYHRTLLRQATMREVIAESEVTG